MPEPVLRSHLTISSQKRFKKIVEIGGFRLVGGAVVEPGEAGGPPSTPRKARAQTNKPTETTRPAKKRKLEEMAQSEAEGDDESVEQGVISEQK